jgi:hypothetical protein
VVKAVECLFNGFIINSVVFFLPGLKKKLKEKDRLKQKKITEKNKEKFNAIKYLHEEKNN